MKLENKGQKAHKQGADMPIREMTLALLAILAAFGLAMLANT